MPGSDAPQADPAQPPPPPPSFGRQAAQLVVIPALIVVAVIALMSLFALLAGREENVQDLVARLRQSSGSGKLALGIQDPRYKDRSLAAATLATKIPEMRDPAQRAELSGELQDILNKSVAEEEDMLRAYLLIALGQLGQASAIPIVADGLGSPLERVRQAAVRALLSWPEPAELASVQPRLLPLTADLSPAVRTEAVLAVGKLAQASTAQPDHAIAALTGALRSTDPTHREARWNAAVALTLLGDEAGAGFVVDVLLNREALAQLPAAWEGPGVNQKLSAAGQDRVILSTLAALAKIGHPKVRARVEELSKKDPSLGVRNRATQIMQHSPRD